MWKKRLNNQAQSCQIFKLVISYKPATVIVFQHKLKRTRRLESAEDMDHGSFYLVHKPHLLSRVHTFIHKVYGGRVSGAAACSKCRASATSEFRKIELLERRSRASSNQR